MMDVFEKEKHKRSAETPESAVSIKRGTAVAKAFGRKRRHLSFSSHISFFPSFYVSFSFILYSPMVFGHTIVCAGIQRNVRCMYNVSLESLPRHNSITQHTGMKGGQYNASCGVTSVGR